MKRILVQLTILLVVGHLSACNSAYQSKKQPLTRSDTTVNTEAVVQHPNPPPPPILSSQKGPDGSQVDLLKAQVNADTLTVELQYKAGPAGAVSSNYAVDQVGVMDEATTKLYRVLKDQSGSYMASPLLTDQGKQLIDLTSSKEKPVSVRFKFSAPPVDTKTISVTIPEVGTYKAIPLSR